MKAMTRIISLLVVLTMMLCCTGLAEVEPEFPFSEEPITLTFYVQTNAEADNYTQICENSEILKLIKEKTNIELNLIPLMKSSEAKEKIVLALSSGNYPDGYMMSSNGAFNKSDIMQYGVQDHYLLPLEEYIDEYAPNVLEVWDSIDGLRENLTATDGHIYGIPRTAEALHVSAYPKLWFNYYWLEKLGLEVPTTIEELYDVLYAFVTEDPNGNGEADEIGLTANISYSNYLVTYLMNSFMDCPAYQTATYPRMYLHWDEESQAVTFLANEDAYKEGLEWIKKFYDAGLISPAAFTQEQDQMKQEVLASDEYDTVGAFIAEHYKKGGDWDRECVEQHYAVLEPVAGPEGVQYQPLNSYANQVTGFNFVLFDTCKHPVEAIKLVNWFYTQEMTVSLGWNGLQEGGGWTLNTDETILDFEGKPMYGILNSNWYNEHDQEYIDKWYNYNLGLLPYADTASVRYSIQYQPTEETIWSDYETFLGYETTLLTPYFPDVCLANDLFMESDDSEEFNELRMTLNSYVTTNSSEFVTGARSLDEWDDYCAELEALGVERYVELYNEYYQH